MLTAFLTSTSPNPTHTYSYSMGDKTQLQVGQRNAEPCLPQQELCFKAEEISLPGDALQPWKMESLPLAWRGVPIFTP